MRQTLTKFGLILLVQVLLLLVLLMGQPASAGSSTPTGEARSDVLRFQDSPPQPTKVTYTMKDVVDAYDPPGEAGKDLLRRTKSELSGLFHNESRRILLIFEEKNTDVCTPGKFCDPVIITKEKDNKRERYRVEIECTAFGWYRKYVEVPEWSRIGTRHWPRIGYKVALSINEHEANHILHYEKKP